MEKFICALYIYLCAFTVPLSFTKIFRKLYPQKTFDNLLSQRYALRLFIRDLLFFIIAFLVFIFALPIAVAIPLGIGTLGDFSFMSSGLFSNIVIILSGIIARIIYFMVRFIVNKILHKNVLMYIGENSRSWAFIMASLCYIAMSLMKIGNFEIEIVGFTSLSIILGRVLWIDFNKGSQKRFFKGFFSLNYQLIFLYASIIGATLAAPAVKYVGIRLANVMMFIGILSAIILIFYMYRKEFHKFFIDLIEEQ